MEDEVDQDMHEPNSFLTKYVWSQDHKVIAIQYSVIAILVGIVALVLSGLMRLQLGFPGSFDFIDPSAYYQFVTMHGMIMVITYSPLFSSVASVTTSSL
jgi:cytochrome c oxidase subunit 1